MVLRASRSISVGGHMLDEQAHQHLLNAFCPASEHGSNIALAKNIQDKDIEPDRGQVDSDKDSGTQPVQQSEQGSQEGPEQDSEDKPDSLLWSEEDSEEVVSEAESGLKSDWLPLIKGQEQVSARSHALLQEAHHMGLLHGVTRLEVARVYLDSPLQPALGRFLPNLKGLHLSRCVVTFSTQGGSDDADATPRAFRNLQTLHLHCVGWRGALKESKQQLRQQLAQLPALTALSLTAGRRDDEADYGAQYATIMDALPATTISQLTEVELGWSDEPVIHVEGVWRNSDLGPRLLSVKNLKLNMLIGDDDLSQLLTLPTLTHLSVVWFAITHSFAGHQCRWQVLELQSVSVETLAWLPLHANLLIKPPSDEPFLCLAVNPNARATAKQALDNMAGSGWLGWRHPHVKFSLRPASLSKQEGDARMVRALPLLNGASWLSLDMWKISAAGVAALVDFASKQQHGFHLYIDDTCTLSLTDMLTLVSCMPAGSHLILSEIDEATFTQLCCAAKGRITLHAK